MSVQLGSALVTGAAKGIGKAIAERLAADGFHVVAIDRSETVRDVVAEIVAAGGRASAHVADIGDRAAIAAIVEQADAIEVVVNNAAIFSDAPFDALSEDDFRRTFEVNLVGSFVVGQEAARRMQRGGRIVNLTSRSFAGGPNHAHYIASKTSVIGLTRAMAIDLSPRDIKVNCVAPGVIDTDLYRSLSPERQTQITALQLLGRIGRPEDVARTVSFLASRENVYITGQIIIVDGGRSLGQGQLPPDEPAGS